MENREGKKLRKKKENGGLRAKTNEVQGGSKYVANKKAR